MTDSKDTAAQALIDAVRAALEGAGLLSGGARLVAAVSGGADSVALLWALCELRAIYSLEIIACHVQHGLRGESSQGDEAFVRELCEAWGVKCEVLHARLEGGMEDPGAETRARNERTRLFGLVMRDNAADALMLAHHMNDQAETALMRLLRGAGAAGLCAMPPVKALRKGVALRPFLNISKREIVEAMRAEGVVWREDESNSEPCTPRNALRINVMPLLEELYPGAQRHIVNAAEALRTDEDCLHALSDALYGQIALERAGVLALYLPALSKAANALRRRALRRWYVRGVALAGLEPDERALGYDDTLKLDALIGARAGDTLNLPCGLMALRGARHLHLVRQGGAPITPPPEDELRVSADISRYELMGAVIRLERAESDGASETGEGRPPRDAGTIWLPLELLNQSPVLRAPRAGDVIHPFGASGSKPLRRWFTDRKTDAPFRAAMPVMAIGSRVIWLPGLCAAEELRARGGGHVCMYLEGGAPYAE